MQFYYWLKVDNDGFCQKCYAAVLPGRYLSDTEQGNPGENHVRDGMVADLYSAKKS